MNMPQITDAHRKLQKLVGHWVGQEKMSPSPWDPHGGSATGNVHNRLALNGFFIVQDYEQQRNGAVSFAGHCVFGCDPIKNAVVMHWFDSMGSTPAVYNGSFQGDVLTVSTQGAFGHSKASFDLSKEKQYTFHMEVSPDGQSWKPFMEGSYTRQG